MVWVKNVVNLKVANSIILCFPSNYITQSKILLVKQKLIFAKPSCCGFAHPNPARFDFISRFCKQKVYLLFPSVSP